MRVLAAAAVAIAAAGPAAAQSAYGDTQLSYQNGVVYDDDLVPGRRPNASFLIEEQAPQSSTVRGADTWSGASGGIPGNSPNLVGADGRAIRAR